MPIRRALVLTALPVEYAAARAHLSDLAEQEHPAGDVYERGEFTVGEQVWQVGLVEMGAGNPNAALKTERAVAFFEPEVILFVGVAGGLKDVAIGDVVVATKVYGYHSGKAEAEFKTRPEVRLPHHRIVERAKAEARKADWLKRLSDMAQPPKVLLGAIAAGEQVLASRKAESYKLIKQSYGDALAVEMESYGFLTAVQAHAGVEALAVRGISDLLEGKAKADKGGSQQRASAHAAAFAFEVLAKLNLPGKLEPAKPPETESLAPKPKAKTIPAPPAFYAEPHYIGSHRFLGRRAQLETLDDWATPANPHPVLLFEAIGGSGKSILTWHWVNHHALTVRKDWAGRFWYSFYERGAVMADFCQRALAYISGVALEDLRKKKTPELSERLLDELRARPWLLVLDGLERVLVSYHRYDAAQLPDEQAGTEDIIAHRDPCAAIRPEDDELLRQLAAAAPSKLLVTTRLTPKILLNAASQPIPGVLRERLPGLRPQDAEELFRACEIRGDSAAIQTYLQQHCDCHPLVTGVLAGLVHDYLPDRGNFDAWAKDPEGGGKLNLAELDLVQKRNHILLYSIETLPEKSRQLLSTLALLSESVDYATLSAFNPHDSAGSQAPLGNPNTGSSASRFEATGSGASKAAFPSGSLGTSGNGGLGTSRGRLTETVKDLEKRGLLQYDGQNGHYDLHPVVRGVAVGRLDADETQRYGGQVVDYFSRQPHNPYKDATSLDDVRGGIVVVRTLLRMGEYRKAYHAYRGDLARALLFNLEAHSETLSLLRPFFRQGWAALPQGLDDSAACYLANDAAGAFHEVGDSKTAVGLYGLSLRNDLRREDWYNMGVRLRNLSLAFFQAKRLAREDRCLRLLLALAEASQDEETLFIARLFRFDQLAELGRFGEAEALWALLNPMGRDWSRAAYRPGDAERCYAYFRYWRGDLQQDSLAEAERLAQTGKNRLSIRSLHGLRGCWNLEQNRWQAAADSLHEAVRMARLGDQTDAAAETRLALAQFYLGQLPDPLHTAAQLENAKWIDPLALAELFKALGEKERALAHALKAYRWAWADGEPYVHRFELNRAAALLQALGEPVPVLPPYNPANDPPLPWEAEVEAAIAKLKAEQAR